jgi:hypothetical protein
MLSPHPSQVAEKKSEAEREGRRRERLDREVRDLKAQVESKNMEVSCWFSKRLMPAVSRDPYYVSCMMGREVHDLKAQVESKNMEVSTAERHTPTASC